MIESKNDLKRYLLADKIALGVNKKRPRIIGDRIWKYQIDYRKAEYYLNTNKHFFSKLMFYYYNLKFKIKSRSMCSEIPYNVIEEGLVIWHGQNIIINGNAKIGKNFSISSGCCVGQAHNQFPVIKDNVEMTIGSKVIGGITVANDVTIGAGAVVVKSIDEPYTTWGGVPAKCISRRRNEYVSLKKERLHKIVL